MTGQQPEVALPGQSQARDLVPHARVVERPALAVDQPQELAQHMNDPFQAAYAALDWVSGLAPTASS